MSEKMKGVYTDGTQMIVLTSYCEGVLGGRRVVKENGDYIARDEVTMESDEFYTRYELCGYSYNL